MTGIEKITERILADARAEAAEIEREAKARCEEIAAAGDAAAQDEYWKLFKKGTDDAEKRGERLGSVAQLAARASRTGAEEIILPAGTDKAFGENVTAQANSLLASAGKNGALRLSSETREMRGGLVLRDGSIEVNCSLDAIVDDVRNDLTGKVASTLFE